MKKLIIGFIIGLCTAIGFTVLAANMDVIDNPFPIFVDGVERDVEAYNIGGRTYLQLRGTGDILGVKVDFNDETKQIIIGDNAPTDNTQDNTNNSWPEPKYSIDGLKAKVYEGYEGYVVGYPDIRNKYPGDYFFSLDPKKDGTYSVMGKGTLVFFESYPQHPSNHFVDLDWYNTTLYPWLLSEGWKQ